MTPVKVNTACDYSVLMPLWYKESTDYLNASLESMLTQTVLPAEIVLITEYEPSSAITELLEKKQGRYGSIPLRVIRNPDLAGKGLGAVLAFGVENCRYDIIARMDTDDISFPERCEKELEVLLDNPQIAIVGGGLEKFSDDPDVREGYRMPPEMGKKLIWYSKFRSPFNHPTVMFRKEVILQVGNYPELKEGEDYDLWYRVLKNGYQGYNLQMPVLHYRSGKEMLRRRKNKRFYRQSLALVRQMRKDRYINTAEAVLAAGMHTVRYYSPFALNEFVYRYVRS